jgi:prevent-host-death family protein
MDVGVRDLKAHLSAYLERAAKGEIITITDRGRPTAVLAPLPARSKVDDGLRDGWISEPLRTRLGPAPRARSTRRVVEVLDEDRNE